MIVTGKGNLQIHFDKMDTRLDLQLHIIWSHLSSANDLKGL